MKSRRNTLAGKRKGKSRSAKYLAKNPKARKKKQAYDKKRNATTKEKKSRAAHNKANRKAGTYGNKDGLDMSRTKKGGFVKEPQRKNRARNGKNGKSTKK